MREFDGCYMLLLDVTSIGLDHSWSFMIIPPFPMFSTRWAMMDPIQTMRILGTLMCHQIICMIFMRYFCGRTFIILNCLDDIGLWNLTDAEICIVYFFQVRGSGTEGNFKDCIFSFALGESKPASNYRLYSNVANGKPNIKTVHVFNF